MAKKESKKYFPTDTDLDNSRFCIQRDIAFCIQKVDSETEKCYIVKYKPSRYKDVSYMRINTTIPASFQNRLKLNEYDAWVKVFECYNKTRLNLEGKNEENKKEYTKFVEIPKQLNNQIDLFEMIKEVENENKLK